MNKHYHRIHFQGKNKMNSKYYFEGWYFKHVSEDLKSVISFIPGISISKDDSHAFIQCIYHNNSGELTSYYFKYNVKDFSVSEEPFFVKIGNNTFSKSSIHVSLTDLHNKIEGTVTYGKLKKLNNTVIQPNIMGIFSYVPGLECNHDIVSMDHDTDGSFTINRKEVSFIGGKGYIEKDWGTSFPEKYIWIQSNHFNNEAINFCCSVASFPVFKIKTIGFFCNMIVDNKEYRFASYNCSKVKVSNSTKNSFTIDISNKKHTLQIEGHMKSSSLLKSPLQGKMSNEIKEGLSGEIHVVMKNKNGDVILDSIANPCGIDMDGY